MRIMWRGPLASEIVSHKESSRNSLWLTNSEAKGPLHMILMEEYLET